MKKPNLNKIINYFYINFNHILELSIHYNDKNTTWPERYLLKCSKCAINIHVNVESKKFPYSFEMNKGIPYITLSDNIKFIMREADDTGPNVRDYDKEKDFLKCEEVQIKNLLE